MSELSNNQGRAYEFAYINALFERLQGVRAVKIEENSSFNANKKAWDLMPSATQKIYEISAKSAVDTVLELEPLMEENSSDELLLIPQTDQKGTLGDVRDIVIERKSISWEVGLSIKHNHEAVKHSRLSYKLDFGKEWFGIPCSENYWNEIKPVFDMLIAEKARGTKFSELQDKDNDVYIPLLNAFMHEVNLKYKLDSSTARKMVEYLIGVTDYYKIVSHDSKEITLIHSFNVHGSLNKPSKIKTSSFVVPVVDLPTRIIALQLKPNSKTTVEMYLDNGWQLSFRIHNAENKIIPSLKFDIQFIGMPPSVLHIECKWQNHKS